MLMTLVMLAIIVVFKWCTSGRRHDASEEQPYPELVDMKERPNSLLQMFGASHINAIVDQFTSFEAVTAAIRKAGLESSNLIFGKKTLDFLLKFKDRLMFLHVLIFWVYKRNNYIRINILVFNKHIS